jgi:hypothetical protein
MAVYFVVPAGGNSNVAATYSTTSGGTTGGAIPTAADDVILDGSSGQFTINAAMVCRSLDCNYGDAAGPYTGTLTLASGISLSLGSMTVSASGVIMRLASGMTLTLGSLTTGGFTFGSSSATQASITSAGKALPMTYFQGGSYLLSDGFSTAATTAVTLTSGTLNTNSQSCSWGLFSSYNANTRTLTLGSSTITLTGSSVAQQWLLSGSNYTANTGSGTLSFTGNSGTFFGGGNYAAVMFSGFGQNVFNGLGGTIGTLTYSAPAVLGCLLSFSSNATIGTLTVSGSSAGTRLLMQSNGLGTTRTLSVGAASGLANVDWQDIAVTGAAAPLTGTSMGDCQGNSGITFDASRTLYGVATANANWNVASAWSTSSGGASGANPPLPQDDVVLDASSGSSAVHYNLMVPRLGRSLTVGGSALVTQSTASTIFGSFTQTQTTTFAPALTLSGRGAYGIAVNTSIANNLTINALGGTYTATTGITMTGAFLLTNGTFTAHPGGISAATYTFQAGTTVNMSTGTWVVTGTGTVWQANASVTVNCGTSTVLLTDQSATAKTFAGGGLTYYNLTLAAGSVVTFSGNNTFNQLTVPPGTGVLFTAGSTNTVMGLTATGQNNGYQRLPGISASYAASPNATPLQVTGNITIDCKCALNNWSVGTQTLVSKLGVLGNYSYWLTVSPGGQIGLQVSATGSTLVGWTSSVTAGFATGSAHWVRASLTIVTGVCQFFTSSDGITWTQLGANVPGTAVASIYNSTAEVEIGSGNTGGAALAAGNFYEARIYAAALGSGAGTPVFDANFTSKPFGANSFTESSTNAATVTINGPLAQIGDGRVQMGSTSPGTPATLSSPPTVSLNYLVLQDITAAGGTPFYAGYQSANNGDNTGWTFTTPPIVYTDTQVGTATLTGVASEDRLASTTPAGTTTLTGAAVEASSGACAPAGVLSTTGSRSETQSATSAPAGTIRSTGASIESSTQDSFTGGATRSIGALVEAYSHTGSTSGGIVLTGSSSGRWIASDSVSDTATLSGAIVERYTPPATSSPGAAAASDLLLWSADATDLQDAVAAAHDQALWAAVAADQEA